MASDPRKLSTAQLFDAFRQMTLIREFEEEVLRQRFAGRIYGPVHPYIGQEAIAVGVCLALGEGDQITSTHRGHGHCIAKGARPDRMMAELFGRIDGYCHGKGGSMHIADFAIGMLGANGIVGAGLPIAAGAALAAQKQGRGRVVACFFGDGATCEGVYHETLNIAALWQLPLVFVLENNQYGGQGAAQLSKLRSTSNLAGQAASYGMPGVVVDGNDVQAVWQAASEAVDRARAGGGPTLLECRSYRMHPHSYRDRPIADLRPEREKRRWAERDPIDRCRLSLNEHGARPNDLTDIQAGVARLVGEAVDFAERSPFPEASDALTDVFADTP